MRLNLLTKLSGASLQATGFRRARKPEKSVRFLHSQRRRQFLRAALVGLLAGTVAVFFQHAVFLSGLAAKLLSGFLNLTLGMFGRFGFILLTTLLAAISTWITQKYAPEAAGSGIPHVKAVLLNLRKMRPGPVIRVKLIGGWMALLSGMSLGREGPTVQIGAAVGQWVARKLRVTKRSYPGLVAAGAGAGLAAAFNAPLAGFLFVMEELRREMSSLTYGTALAASVCAVIAQRWFLGQGASFYLTDPSPVALKLLPAVAVLGVLGGLLGVAFNRGIMGVLSWRDHIRVPRWVLGGLVGCIAGAIYQIVPELTGTGHEFTQELLRGSSKIPVGLGILLVFLLVRFLFTLSSYATGVPGGIFSPILTMGALLGYAFGLATDILFPSLGVSPPVMATLGMGAVLAGAVRSPLTGVVLIVEMTAEYRLLFALLLAAFVSYLLAEALHDTPIYERLLNRDLLGSQPAQILEEPILFEVLVEPNSFLDQTQLRDTGFPSGVTIVSIARGNGYLVPNSEVRLHAGDLLTVQVTVVNSVAAVRDVQQAASAD